MVVVVVVVVVVVAIERNVSKSKQQLCLPSVNLTKSPNVEVGMPSLHSLHYLISDWLSLASADHIHVPDR